MYVTDSLDVPFKKYLKHLEECLKSWKSSKSFLNVKKLNKAKQTFLK